ncbi:MAG: chromosomal replication initiator protein DnaA [Candidatus Gastranaerophilaceae bacterium]
MEIAEVKKIWSSVKEEIINTVPATSHPWIMPLEAVGYENGIFSVITGQSFAIQIIRKNHYQQILDVFESLGHHIKKFDIIFDEKLSKEFKKQKEKELRAQKKAEEKTIKETAFDGMAKMQSQSNLNLKYKFENFVVGDNSKLAHAVAFNVAQHPAEKYNPLFIYGGSGLGKTHLMQAIGHYTLFNNSKLKVRYIKTEDYVNELVDNLRKGGDTNDRMAKFRQKYRNVDILLIDDIQFVESKNRTMEEIFHTFDTLYNKNKQIVITSDRLPKDIPTLPDRLRSRFEMGIVVDITPPDYETRVAILTNLAEQQGLNIPFDVYDYIAKNFESNVRELEGAFNKVTAYADIENTNIDIEFTKKVLKCELNTKTVSIEEIASITAEYFDVTVSNLKSPARAQKISEARRVAVYLAREITKASYEDIAEFFEKKHPTILYSYQKVKDDLRIDSKLKQTIRELKHAIKYNS